MVWKGVNYMLFSLIAVVVAGSKTRKWQALANKHPLLCTKCREQVLGNTTIKSKITFFTSHFSAYRLPAKHVHCQYACLI